MRACSASEAVWPAFKRMAALLFQSPRAERFLGLAALAVLSEGVLLSLRVTASDQEASDPRAILFELPDRLAGLDLSRLLDPEWIIFTALGAALAVFLFFLAGYLLVLLRVGLFRAVVSGELPAGKVWAQCERPAWGLFKGYLFVGGVLLLLGGGLVALIAVAMVTIFSLRTPDGKFDAGVFLLMFFPIIAVLLCTVFLALMAEVALHDFVLPVMVLEGKSFRQAWKQARHRIWVERETFFSFFLLRYGLPFLAGFVLAVAAWYPVKGIFLLLGMSAQGFAAMLQDATGVGAWFHLGFQALLRAVEACTGLAIAFVLGGPLAVWTRAYAIEFYASRWKPLAHALALADESRLRETGSQSTASERTA